MTLDSDLAYMDDSVWILYPDRDDHSHNHGRDFDVSYFLNNFLDSPILQSKNVTVQYSIAPFDSGGGWRRKILIEKCGKRA